METLLGILIAIVVVILAYFKYSFGYWKRKGLPYLEPKIPFGTSDNPTKRKVTYGMQLKGLHDQLKNRGHKHGGLYLLTSPRYMPVHPDYIKNVLQNDFDHFVERGFYYNEKDDPLSANLFAIGGHQWRKLRTKLTPTFTSGKMKTMFNTLVQCGYQMQEAMDNYCNTKEGVDIKNVLACFTTDIIGSCAFGLDCNSFKSPDADFRMYGKKIFDPLSKLQSARVSLGFAWPELARKLGIRFFPTESTEFFMSVVKDAVKYREANNIERKDMLQVLIDLKNDSNAKEKFTIQQLAAQAFVFFFAGFETSSTAMTFCLYELAENQDIQQKVRDEINSVLEKHGGEINYDAITEMKYMTQVVEETLRKYPPLSFLFRECVKDYKIPETDVVLEKGMKVVISILALHYDPEYYPDPETFDPERFSEVNKQNRLPFTYMPFGEGPRICIGLRFGMLQTKVGLAVLLKNFKLSFNKRTAVPFEMDPFSFILTSKTGIYLDIEKLN